MFQLIRPVNGGVETVTASASPFANGMANALMVSATADVTVTFADGSSALLPSLAPGVWHGMDITHMTVISTGTAVIGRNRPVPA